MALKFTLLHLLITAVCEACFVGLRNRLQDDWGKDWPLTLFLQLHWYISGKIRRESLKCLATFSSYFLFKQLSQKTDCHWKLTFDFLLKWMQVTHSDKSSDNEYNTKFSYQLCRDVPGQLKVLIIFGMLHISPSSILLSLTLHTQFFTISSNSTIIFVRDRGILLP